MTTTRTSDTATHNCVVVSGVLSSEPRITALPSGSELRAYEVTTVDNNGTRRSVPVVWLEPRRAPRLVAGDAVVVTGLIRRRFFRSGGATLSRTEVEADTVARAGSDRGRRALDAVLERLRAHGSFG